MDPIHIALLVVTGAAAGIIATIVGGAAVVVYPALIASGVSPQLAAICNLTALMPATMLAALSDYTQLPPFNRAFVGLALTSIVGAGVGILMLGVFTVATGGDYRSANVTKNFVSGLNGLVATIIFISQGVVIWPQTLALMAGTIIG